MKLDKQKLTMYKRSSYHAFLFLCGSLAFFVSTCSQNKETVGSDTAHDTTAATPPKGQDASSDQPAAEGSGTSGEEEKNVSTASDDAAGKAQGTRGTGVIAQDRSGMIDKLGKLFKYISKLFGN